jgi:UDP-2-acetamido-2,6-beta-L-arabino-hexul-4-ose reductase
MRILVTGSNGFIGKNLTYSLLGLKGFNTTELNRNSQPCELPEIVSKIDIVVHLAAVNRTSDAAEFKASNVTLTSQICDAIAGQKRSIPLIFASSIHASQESEYGLSKRKAEAEIEAFFKKTNNPVIIYQLPGIFGKWCKPNYNSVVATFCHNTAHDLPIEIHDSKRIIRLTYIDDLISDLAHCLSHPINGLQYRQAPNQHLISLGELADQIKLFKECDGSIKNPTLKDDFSRALYSTYMSYLPITSSSYSIAEHKDSRGSFVEMLQIKDFGQVSFITANPGITRGGHFHHSKIEKFLVVKGFAKFQFKNVVTHEKYEIETNHLSPRIVQTLPGWSHDITNVGNDEMIAIIWSNEVFDPVKPDTIGYKVI